MNICDINDLKDKYLHEFYLSDDRKELEFIISDNGDDVRYRLTLQAFGDCCSRSWVEDYELECFDSEDMRKVGNRIEEIENTDLGSIVGLLRSEQKLSFYKTEFILERGKLIIEYRNDSNGYYGGSLEFKSLELIPESGKPEGVIS